MTRQESIAKLCFRGEGMYIMGKVPTRFVTVGGKPEDYADDELALLAAFTDERQADYHRRCGTSKLDWADNFICFEKDGTRWGRKRYSWREGRLYSASLPEAVGTFWSDRYDAVIGDIVLTVEGTIVQITGEPDYEAKPNAYPGRRLADGAAAAVERFRYPTISAVAPTIEALGDLMRMAMRHRSTTRYSVTPEHIAASAAAITACNDPGALETMWRSRVPDFFEFQALEIAAAA